MKQTYLKQRKEYLRKLCTVGVFTALAYVVMVVIRIPIEFLTLDVKDAVITLCGFLFGPVSALFASIVVPLIEMVTVSHTYLYGFLMNAVSTVAFAVTASLIYRFQKNRRGMVIGLVSGIFLMTAVMMLFNLLITPAYMGVSVETVKQMIPTLLLPFNFGKAVLNAILTFALYPPVSKLLQSRK